MNPKLLGAIILAVGAIITYTSNYVVEKLFKAEKPAEDKRSIIIKIVGLLIAIFGMLVLFEIIIF